MSTQLTPKFHDESGRSGGPQGPCRVLVVEDHADTGAMLATFLSAEGHLVRLAHNAETALEIANEFRPEVCLCDIGLPEISGYELAPRLRSNFPEALLISVTGWSGEQDNRRAKEAGFDHHVVKPVELEELLRLIGDGLGQQRHSRKSKH